MTGFPQSTDNFGGMIPLPIYRTLHLSDLLDKRTGNNLREPLLKAAMHPLDLCFTAAISEERSAAPR
jgi:hypothetical protein